MQKLSTAWLLWAALASLGCEGAPGDSAPVDPFLGRWSCGETRTLTFSTPAGSPDATTQTRFVLNVAVADGQITMYATSEAGVPCQLKFTESGTSATLMTGQSCMTPDGIQLDYKMGTADLTAAGLQTSLTF